MIRTTAPPTPVCTLPLLRVAFICAYTSWVCEFSLDRASDCAGTPLAGRANSESLPLLQFELLLELRVGLGQCFLGAHLALEIGQPRREHGAVQAQREPVDGVGDGLAE